MLTLHYYHRIDKVMAKVEERDKDELADLDERLEIARLEKYVRTLPSFLFKNNLFYCSLRGILFLTHILHSLFS